MCIRVHHIQNCEFILEDKRDSQKKILKFQKIWNNNLSSSGIIRISLHKEYSLPQLSDTGGNGLFFIHRFCFSFQIAVTDFHALWLNCALFL